MLLRCMILLFVRDAGLGKCSPERGICCTVPTALVERGSWQKLGGGGIWAGAAPGEVIHDISTEDEHGQIEVML
jgi:hypothetical protein